MFFVVLPSLPPCTETVIDGKSLRYKEGETADQSGTAGPLRPDAGPDSYSDLPGGTYLQLRGLNFVGRNGVPWTRMDGKLTQENRRPVCAALPGGVTCCRRGRCGCRPGAPW